MNYPLKIVIFRSFCVGLPEGMVSTQFLSTCAFSTEMPELHRGFDGNMIQTWGDRWKKYHSIFDYQGYIYIYIRLFTPHKPAPVLLQVCPVTSLKRKRWLRLGGLFGSSMKFDLQTSSITCHQKNNATTKKNH